MNRGYLTLKVGCLAWLWACVVFNAAGESKPIVNVGVLMPLSGPAANFGSEVQGGVQLASEVHSRNKTGKYAVKLIYQDTKCQPREAVSAYHSLRVKGVRYIIGAGCSSSTLAVAPLAEKDKVILFTPVSSATTISSAGDFIFRNHTRVDLEFKRLAEWISKKYQKVGFLYDRTNDATVQAKDFFEKTFPGEVITIPFDAGAGDFRAGLLKLKRADVDVIHLEALTPDLITLLKQMSELRIKKPLTSDKMAGVPEFPQAAGELAEGIVYPVAEYDKTTNLEFWDFYVSERHKEPSIFSAQGYDVFNLVVAAIERCYQDTTCSRDYFYQVKDYPGVAGKTTIDNNGDVDKKIALMKIENGKFVKLKGN